MTLAAAGNGFSLDIFCLPTGQQAVTAWQTWQVLERYDPGRVAEDLADCRQRGLDWLDRKSGNQQPVRAAELQRLAEEYVRAGPLAAAGRIAQIKTLLRDGIDEWSRQGHPDAGLVRDLFFGDPEDGAIKPPGVLLKIAQKRAGDATETRFRERRNNVFRSFARFLTAFADPDPQVPDDAGDPAPVSEDRTQVARLGFVGDNEHFIQLLAEAVNVTIIGITNERLAPILQEALHRKRAGGRPDAFWGSLRIVFLHESLLGAVNDEREALPDSGVALRQRRQEATWARRSVRVFLKRSKSTRWRLYEYSYLPPVTGSLLEFDDPQRKKVAQLLIKRPRQPRADHLYLELAVIEEGYLSALFEDIIGNSEQDRMIVPVGYPANATFWCEGLRLHSSVLQDGSEASGWLPMILVITFRRRGSHVEALLQLRTEQNSGRELNRLSHLGGHIQRKDLRLPKGAPVEGVSFDLADPVPIRAAQRLVREVTGVEPGPALQPMATGGYLYPDKEHLFFFVFALELPEGTHLPRHAEMHAFPLPELLSIRANQVLRTAARLCLTTGVSERARAAAAEIVALNLCLHDYDELGRQLLALAGRPDEERAQLAATIGQLVTDGTSPSWMSESREVRLMGLAGWQYREFFSVLLPLYAQVGIDGAADLLKAVGQDEHKAAAVGRLRELYEDEHLMASMPFEP
jgi:hypothetical protein